MREREKEEGKKEGETNRKRLREGKAKRRTAVATGGAYSNPTVHSDIEIRLSNTRQYTKKQEICVRKSRKATINSLV